MPDNNDKISLEHALTRAAGGDVEEVETPEVDNEPEAEAPVEAAPVTTEKVTQPVKEEQEQEPVEEKPAEEKTSTEKKVNPMKEVREKYTTEKLTREKIETAISRYSNGDYGFKLKDFNNEGKIDYDAFIAAMDQADTKVKAESKGITPEVQAEIERIEKEKIELNKQRLQISMDRALTNLQQNMGVKSAEVNNFFKDAMSQKKNPYQWLAQGGDLQDLYILVYRDKLLKREIDTAVEAAKSKWQEEQTRQTKVPAANPAKPVTTESKNTNGPSLQDLLAQAVNKK
jgi:hypothetical protein